jgi:hypothetical protein
MEQFPSTTLLGIAARGMWRAAAIGFASYADGCTQMVRLMSGGRRARRDPAAPTSAPATAPPTAGATPVAANKPAITAVSVPRANSGEALEPTRSATLPIEAKVTVRPPGAAKQPASRSGLQKHGRKKKDRTPAKGLDALRANIEGDDLDSAPLK